MRKQVWWIVVGMSLVLVALLTACQGAAGATGPAGAAGATGPQGPPGPPGPAAALPSEHRVQLTITKADIPTDRKPVVTFKITDEAGNPETVDHLDKLPIPGAMPARFTLAYLKEDAKSGLTAWSNYVLVPAKGKSYVYQGRQKSAAIDEGTQPSILMDMGGSYKEVGAGTYTYTFATVLPENYDRNATHRVGGEAAHGERTHVANATFDFVPAGGPIKTRQVVASESCNQCHDPLAVHGGLRKDTKLCVICHTSQNVDLETGNTTELKNMVHKIHRSGNLPSVLAGGNYQIVGFNQTVFDWKVIWPQFGSGIGDVRTCSTCHGETPAGMKAEDWAKIVPPNVDNWKTAPSRAACGACHDNIDFATGKSTIAGKRDHLGGPQKDDNACKLCHVADSGKEFDASVVGAHTIPNLSKQLKGINVEILRVTSTAPGQFPQVVFSAKDNAGKVIPRSDITSIAFNVNGPTTDYLGPATTEAAVLANILITADGNYAYNLTRAIPSDAKGTYAVGMEARRLEFFTGNEGASANVSSASYNPIVYIPVTDTVPVPRRQIVATEKCNVCHEKIAFHGGGRLNTAGYCQLCHNPANVDVPQLVPPRLGGPFDVPPQSINFRFMIHRIHTGEELTRSFTIYRTRGVFNFNEIGFPGDRTNCAKCHVGNSYTLPLPATNANTLAPRELYSPLGPAASACLGCHDSTTASAHAAIMTSSSGETCAVCHGRGKDFAVETVHKR